MVNTFKNYVITHVQYSKVNNIIRDNFNCLFILLYTFVNINNLDATIILLKKKCSLA